MGIKNTQICLCLYPHFFILKEVFIIKSTIAFDTLNEVYEYYNDNVLKITNLKQIIFYSNIFSVLPDWIGESPYDGKLIAYYGKERTKECWEKWKRTSVSNMEKDLV